MSAQIIKFPRSNPAFEALKMSYDEAMFEARRRTNERVSKAGRTRWNRVDWNYCVKVFDELHGSAFRRFIGVE